MRFHPSRSVRTILLESSPGLLGRHFCDLCDLCDLCGHGFRSRWKGQSFFFALGQLGGGVGRGVFRANIQHRTLLASLLTSLQDLLAAGCDKSWCLASFIKFLEVSGAYELSHTSPVISGSSCHAMSLRMSEVPNRFSAVSRAAAWVGAPWAPTNPVAAPREVGQQEVVLSNVTQLPDKTDKSLVDLVESLESCKDLW